MTNVLEQARLLGQAIEQSEEHRAMRTAEEAVMQDEKTADMMHDYADLKMEVQRLLEGEAPDQQALEVKTDRLHEMQDELNQMPLIQQMMEARNTFTDMMGQVNQVIQFMITGEVSECGGHCADCGGGCGHTH